ncbi:MAG: hypothetical protein EAY76_01035 [Alphaproteobacteria bacterium]|nr:MAG: hypothetical protein EAY76_01035 [Alphaproteobacteria bacterium]
MTYTTKKTSSRRFLRDNSAVAAVEFAIIAPFLLLLLVGLIELGNFIMFNQKLDKATSQIGNFVSMAKTPKEFDQQQVQQLMNTFATLMSPYNVDTTGSGGNGGMIVSIVGQNPNRDAMIIQRQYRAGGAANSEIGTEGSTVSAAQLGSIVMRPNDVIIVTETMMSHSNLTGPLLPNLSGLFGGTSGATATMDNSFNRRTAFHRFRFDGEFEKIEVIPSQPGTEPPVCGYYRDIEDSKGPTAQGTSMDARDYDKGSQFADPATEGFNPNEDWEPSRVLTRDIPSVNNDRDEPSPCVCYTAELGRHPALEQKLWTCNTRLIAEGCPKHPTICCPQANGTYIRQNCNACVDETDTWRRPHRFPA